MAFISSQLQNLIPSLTAASSSSSNQSVIRTGSKENAKSEMDLVKGVSEKGKKNEVKNKTFDSFFQKASQPSKSTQPSNDSNRKPSTSEVEEKKSASKQVDQLKSSRADVEKNKHESENQDLEVSEDSSSSSEGKEVKSASSDEKPKQVSNLQKKVSEVADSSQPKDPICLPDSGQTISTVIAKMVEERISTLPALVATELAQKPVSEGLVQVKGSRNPLSPSEQLQNQDSPIAQLLKEAVAQSPAESHLQSGNQEHKNQDLDAGQKVDASLNLKSDESKKSAIELLRELTSQPMKAEKVSLKLPTAESVENIAPSMTIKGFADSIFIQQQLQAQQSPSMAQVGPTFEKSLQLQASVGERLSTSSQLVQDMRVFMETMSANANEKGGEITLSLRPAALGLVKVGIQVEEGAVRVMINAAQSSAKEVLQSQVGDLKQHLHEAGYKVQEVTIGSLSTAAAGGSAESKMQDRSGNSNQQQNQQQSFSNGEQRSFLNQHQKEFHEGLRQRGANGARAINSVGSLFDNVQAEVAA